MVGTAQEPPRLAYWKGLLGALDVDDVLHALRHSLAHNEFVTAAHVRRSRDPSRLLAATEVSPAVLRWVKRLQDDRARSRSPPACRRAIRVSVVVACVRALRSGTMRL